MTDKYRTVQIIVVELWKRNFIAPPLPARDIIDDIFWAAVAAAILICAAVFAYRARRWWVGGLAGAWRGLIGGLMGRAIRR